MRIGAVLGTTVACAVLALSVTACGQSTPSGASGSVSTQQTTTSSATPKPSGPPCTVDQITVTPNFGSTPTVTLPKDCATPTTLLSKDIVTGTGAAIEKGDSISADYQLTTWSNDKMVQQSFGTQPFTTPIGVGQVIPGWDQGLIGQRAGGRRLLVVPPALGYGNTSQDGIKANETLVFVIDVHSVTPPPANPTTQP
ncbi:MAG TPA: FKBP-type peptidyl-prolyl cis-trans isomerase [Pseudonocardiaceae bacterium]|nr:FKBP-type peptidyl-prolyl cis-trans isomerase [Pseudonocardiaceae bacterium]